MSNCADIDNLSDNELRHVCEIVQAGGGPVCFKDSCKCKFLKDMCNVDNCNVPANCPKGLRDVAQPSGFIDNLTLFQKIHGVILILIVILLVAILIKV